MNWKGLGTTMRLVDVDNAYEVLTDYYHQRTELQHKALKEALGRVPTVESVKHGRWVNDNHQLKCSICGNPIPIRKVVLRGEVMWEDNNPVNYCPNCGARMDGDDEDADEITE